jgi:branched-chain amino acid transport system substrate-binding protein
MVRWQSVEVHEAHTIKTKNQNDWGETMQKSHSSALIGRRAFLRTAGAAGAVAMVGPAIIPARAETSIKIGMINPLTGVFAATARNEVDGARLALDEINAKGGIIGRPAELLVEDSANNVSIGVLKARKLIDFDNVNFLLGDVNSAIAQAITQVSHEKGVLHIVPGGHTDPITGTDCHWNVFRVCPSTAMQANAIAEIVAGKFGKNWYFLTPDYAFGHTLQAAFEAQLARLGGKKVGGDLAPLGTSDYSPYLMKARAAKPEVLLVLLAGSDLVNGLKRIGQLGLDKQMAIAGGLMELELLGAVPPEARIGWWVFEWYWKQPDVPGVDKFVQDIIKRTQKVPTARTWFGYAAMHTLGLIANEKKSLESVALARALEGFTLPPEIGLQPIPLSYRSNDHQLTSAGYVGSAKREGQHSEDLFDVAQVVSGSKIIPADTGCVLNWPA